MKFEKLAENKIKIFFTLEEMQLNHLSKDLLLSDNFISQHLLQVFLERAEKELNFKVNDENILIEVLAIPNGFSFTITRIESDSFFVTSLHFFYEFETFDDYLDFCTYIKNLNWSILNDFSLLFYNNTYYLITNSNLSDELHYILCKFSNKHLYSLRF